MDTDRSFFRIHFGLLCFVVSLPSLGNPASPTPPQFPDAPVATFAQAWLRLCQMPDLDRLTQWISANLAGVKDNVAIDIAHANLNFCRENGGLDPAEIVESSRNTLSVKAVGIKSGIWLAVWWGVNEAGKINSGGHSPTIPPEKYLPRDLSDAGVASYIRNVVARRSHEGLFSGIVMVARGTKVIATASGGFANRDNKRPITAATQFTLGSMGKLFTAVAIGQLIDQGKISLNDTVGKFFPDYPNAAVREKVTVDMLLSHTAGMGDFLSKRTPSMMKSGVKRAEEFMPLYDRDEPRFEPGSSWAYSNAGLALGGAIVEKVSSEDYPSYLRRHIFAVAGMRHSDPNNAPHAMPALVTPYSKKPSKDGATQDWNEAEHDIGSPAGGAVSTAEDLVRFADALRNGKLMSKATLGVLTTPNAHSPAEFQYGDAFVVGNVYGRATVGHSGGFPGVSTDLKLFLGSTYTVVTLANLDYPADQYADSIAVALVAAKLKSSN
jgi:CubicO group peptidase (beta-lactamase class C family)